MARGFDTRKTVSSGTTRPSAPSIASKQSLGSRTARRALSHSSVRSGRVGKFSSHQRALWASVAKSIPIVPAGRGDKWRYSCSLGSGASGHASLWIRTDADGNIINRVVTKDVWLGKNWDLDINWAPGFKYVSPMEFIAANDINKRYKDAAIVQHTLLELHPELQMFRIHMEYCAHGDLEQVIANYRRLRDDAQAKGRTEALATLRIPAKAIWAIIESVASALCLLHYGEMPDGPRRNWLPHLHRDIKPDNLLLGAPHPKKWLDLPTVKLGDFGLLSTGQNGKMANGQGTPGYQAPEQQRFDNPVIDKAFATKKMSGKSDVWSLGRTILSLMRLELIEEVPAINFKDHRNWRPRFPDDIAAFYPDDLRTLVVKCLEMDPAKRPDAVALWRSVRKVTTHFDTFEGMPVELPMITRLTKDEEKMKLP